MSSTSPGCERSDEVADNCFHQSSPISLVELLPPLSSTMPHGSQASSAVSPSLSLLTTCTAHELLEDGIEPVGKLIGACPSRGGASFAPPPGLFAVSAHASESLLPPCALPLSRAATCPPVPDNAEAKLQILSPKSASLLAPPDLKRAASSPGDTAREEAVCLSCCKVAGVDCIRAEWRIENVCTRMKSSMGKAIVSPPFHAGGLTDLRLMVFPDYLETKGERNRKSKEKYVETVTKGPLSGALKLKSANVERHVLNCFLTVGTERRGPFSYDFSQHEPVHGCDDFGVDWLKQLDPGRSCLRVSLEVFDVRRKEQ